jgi:hypothetical protein
LYCSFGLFCMFRFCFYRLYLPFLFSLLSCHHFSLSFSLVNLFVWFPNFDFLLPLL